MEIRVARTLLIAVRPQFVAAREDTLHRAVDLRQLFRIFESQADGKKVHAADERRAGGAPARVRAAEFVEEDMAVMVKQRRERPLRLNTLVTRVLSSSHCSR